MSNSSKKKIISVCLVVALMATLVIGATLAYFTDTSKMKNTFVIGNKVNIELNEDPNSDPSKDPDPIDPTKPDDPLFPTDTPIEYPETPTREDGLDYKDVYPGAYLSKMPQVTIKADSQKAYVFAELAVDNASTLYNVVKSVMPGSEKKLNDTFLFYGSTGGKENSIIKGTNNIVAYWEVGEGDAKVVHVVFGLGEQGPKVTGVGQDQTTADNIITLFKAVKVPTEFDNAAIEALKDKTITLDVNVYAIQSNLPGSGDVEKEKTAFKELFKNVVDVDNESIYQGRFLPQ